MKNFATPPLVSGDKHSTGYSVNALYSYLHMFIQKTLVMILVYLGPAVRSIVWQMAPL